MSFIPLGLMTIEYDMRKEDCKTNVGPHSRSIFEKSMFIDTSLAVFRV
jgi:hypothetical protein